MKKLISFMLSLGIVSTIQLPVINVSADEESVLLGDGNKDGIINVLDLIELKQSIINGYTGENLDINQDGVFNSIDTLSLKKIILNLDNPNFVPNENYYVGQDGLLYLNGLPFSGVYTNQDSTNYYYNMGELVTNAVIGEWIIDENGIATSKLNQWAFDFINSNGNTAEDIFSYMTTNYTVHSMTDRIVLSSTDLENDTVTSQIVEYNPSNSSVVGTGWACCALYLAENGKGKCYYSAILQDYLFRKVGLTSRIVYGTASNMVCHYWNQVLVDGVWLNYDTYFNDINLCGVTNDELSSLVRDGKYKSTYRWYHYIVPDNDYNGCYYYDSEEDYNNNVYTYLVNDIYYTN